MSGARLLFVCLLSPLALSFALGPAAPPAISAGETPRNVLILYTFDPQTGWELSADIANASTHAPVSIQVFDEYLDLARFPQQNPQTLIRLLHRKYSGVKFAAVVLVGSPALDFWVQNHAPLAPNVPVVVLGVNPVSFGAMHLGENYITRDFSYNDPKLIDWIQKLQPKLQNIFFVAGAPSYETNWAANRAEALRHYRPSLNYSVLTMQSAEVLGNEMAHLPPQSAVIFYLATRDASGHFLSNKAALDMLSRRSNAPIYVSFSNMLGHGVAGGRIIDHKAGESVADLLARLFQGEPASQLTAAPFQQNIFVADWEQLKHWGIDPKRIPAGTLIIDRQLTFWEKYGSRLALLAAALAVGAALILLLLLELRKRREIEARMRDLSGRLLTAQEEERGRIARELHDELGQQLAVLGFGLTALQQQIEAAPAEASARAIALEDNLQNVAGSLRRLSNDLHPPVLDHAGLPAALRGLAKEFGAASSIGIAINADERGAALPSDIALCLFRVCQEALRNVTKHARANAATVKLKVDTERAVLSVSDNGVGFGPGTKPGGLGLQSMRERARILNGALSVKSQVGSGTTITVVLPLVQESFVPEPFIPQEGSTPGTRPNGR